MGASDIGTHAAAGKGELDGIAGIMQGAAYMMLKNTCAHTMTPSVSRKEAHSHILTFLSVKI
jgi:hypothetical protein